MRTDTMVKPYVPLTCCVTELDWSYKDSTLCQTFQYGPPKVTGGEANHGLYYRVLLHTCYNTFLLLLKVKI